MTFPFDVRHRNPASAFPRAGLGSEPTVAELRRYIDSFVHFDVPKGLWVLLWAAILVTVATVVLILVVLARRIKAQTLWLFRLERGLFIPNTMMTFLLLEGAYIVMFTIYIVSWFAIHATGRLTTRPIGVFWCIVWAPLWAGGFWAAWGTLWSIPGDVLGRSGASEKYLSPRLLNAIFVAIHFIVIVPAIVLAVLFYSEYLDSLFRFEDWQAATAMLPDGPASEELIAEGVVIWQGLIDALYWLAIAEWYWAAVAISHALVYGIVGGSLVRGLAKHMKRHFELHGEALSRQDATGPAPGEVAREQVFQPAFRAHDVPVTRTRGQQLQLAFRNVLIHFVTIVGLSIFFSSAALFETLTQQTRLRTSPERYGNDRVGDNFALTIASSIGAAVVGWALISKEFEPVIFSWRTDDSPAELGPVAPRAPRISTMLSSTSTGFTNPTTSHTRSTTSSKSARPSSKGFASTAPDLVPLRTMRLEDVRSSSPRHLEQSQDSLSLERQGQEELEPCEEEVTEDDRRPSRALHHVESGESFPLGVAELTPTRNAEGRQ